MRTFTWEITFVAHMTHDGTLESVRDSRHKSSLPNELYYFACIITNNYYIVSRVYKLEVNMNHIHINDTMTADEFKFRMLNSKDIQEHNRWQALYLAKAKGFSAKEIADIIGVSKYSVNKWVYNFNHIGEESLFSRSKGGVGGI